MANAQWFKSLPESVHACFYNSAIADSKNLAAFVNCQQTDGGEKCIRDIPAGLNCLNNNHVQERFYGYGYGYPAW